MRFGRGLRQFGRWFKPGIGVKRWLLFLMLGITIWGLGLAILLTEIYISPQQTWVIEVVSMVALRFMPRPLRVLIFAVLGAGFISWGVFQLNRSLLKPFMRPGSDVVGEITQYRFRRRGPHVVMIGGGHGLSTLLRGFKDHTHNLTAIVTVADDGGSSGRLRETFGILPPGDIRNCLAAMSNDEDLLTQLFQYRFSGAPGLDGHSFGNLFITALSEITGSFEEAVAESGRVLSVHGRVLPATLHNVRLVADVQLPNQLSEVRIEGESRIPEMAGQVRRVWLEPNNPPAFPPVIQALLGADIIVIGPGSLYTSILPNLLVPDLLAAIRASRALIIFVCNIATQAGETEAYSCYDHVCAVENHIGKNLFDLFVCNNCYEEELPQGSQWVKADARAREDKRLYCADLLDSDHPWRHDSKKLSQVLMNLFYERTGPLLD